MIDMPLPTNPLEPDGFGLPSTPPAFPVSAAPTPAPLNPPIPPTLPLPGMQPAPQMPTFHPQAQQQQPPMQSRIMELLPILIGGLKKPEDIGAALRGLQVGRDRAMQQQEHAQQTEERRSKEAADFYGRAASDAMNFDDPALFERWRQSIAPLAQFYGIDANAFQFNQTKGTKAKQSKLVSALDAMEKRDPSLLQRDDFRITTPEFPDGVEAATVRTWRGQAMDKSGKTILPTAKADVPNTPEEQFYAQFAKERGVKAFSELTTKDQADARKQWQESGRAEAGGSDYGRFLARFAKERGKTVEALTVAEETQAKKLFGQADDRAASGNTPRDRFNVQQVTKEDGKIGLVRVNLDTGEVSPIELPSGAGGAGKASDTERLSKGYYDRTTASNKTAESFEQQLSALGSQIDVKLPNLLKSEAGQQYQQAKDEFINAALRRESGAAIQPSEYTRYDKIYFVAPGDTAATIKQKQAARKRVVDNFRIAAGNLGGGGSTTTVQKWGRDAQGHPVRLAQ